MAKSSFKIDVINEITKGTERDKQVRVGPSDLGNPCPKCLGRALAGEKEPGEFSLYPWLGTAGHEYLENHTFPNDEHELRLFVGDVEGYGPIKGTTDMYQPDHKRVVDWKFVGLKKIKKYRVSGAPDQYRYQGQLYGRGCELSGRPVDEINIVFIPRDSGNVNDIFVYEEAYQPEMAEAALTRAGFIYKIVTEEGWQSLPSDDDCYTCNNQW